MPNGLSVGKLYVDFSFRLSIECTFSSKDTLICVWDRATRVLSQTLSGHDGPVNAIGIQNDKVASVSGDGKMILWDILTGNRIRAFEGHERGLACVVFKVGY
jgi:F-box and WD-40 domain protein 1/11